MPKLTLIEMPKAGPLIGIDPGSRTLGIAACDSLRMIASPIECIARGRKLAPSLDRLFEVYDQRGAVGMIMGLPLHMDGSPGRRTQAAHALANNILARRDIPLAFQDERLSTAEAERAMLAADLSRARRAESIDASAAAIILKAALDRLAFGR